ncbi:uncharacterized protein LOC108100842 isoform X1 [Drosophila ficusphila]|uniref:uncharacterized protein LOC108100842 isoform X1 n=1 Tax=Drosophila ficusphila TaxID=30025 RepID=UPI0007E693D0|nr:uncharacterized protein LOC108100842 isoform X1 [Drosophila ficusphila]
MSTEEEKSTFDVKAQTEDENLLKILLRRFDLFNIFNELKDHGITYRSLKYISDVDINQAISNIGYRAELRHKLTQWQNYLKSAEGIHKPFEQVNIQPNLPFLNSFTLNLNSIIQEFDILHPNKTSIPKEDWEAFNCYFQRNWPTFIKKNAWDIALAGHLKLNFKTKELNPLETLKSSSLLALYC